MRLRIITAALICFCTAVTPASANWYLSRRKAVHFTRQYFHYEVGYKHTSATCTQPNGQPPRRGYIYHRWRCAFAAGNTLPYPSCTGEVFISGSNTGANYYYERLIYDQGNCPLGTSP